MTLEDAAVVEILAAMRWPEGFQCPRCDHRGYWRLARRPRVFGCNRCGQQTSVTAGTLMHRARKPLRIWLIAAVKEAEGRTSAAQLSRELDIRYETVWQLLHRVRRAACERAVRLEGELSRAAKGVRCVGGERWAFPHLVMDDSGAMVGTQEWRSATQRGCEHLLEVVAPGRGLASVSVGGPVLRALYALAHKLQRVHFGTSKRWLQRYIDGFCAAMTWRSQRVDPGGAFIAHALRAPPLSFEQLGPPPVRVQRRAYYSLFSGR